MHRNLFLLTLLIAATALSGAAWADGPAEGAAHIDTEDGDAPEQAGEQGQAEAIAGRRYRRTRKRVRTRRTRRRVVRRVYRPRRRRHVVVVTHQRRPRRFVRRETHIVRRHHERHVVSQRQQRSGLSAGIRFLALSLGDTSLRTETFQGATLAGLGGYIRGKFHEHVGIELSLDILGSDEATYQQISLPIMGAITGHIFPDAIFDVYGLAGAGMVFDEITYFSRDGAIYEESYSQLAGQLGAGLEANFGSFQLTSDVRWLMLQPRPERDPGLRAVVPLTDPKEGAESKLAEPDGVNHAVQFMIGLGGSF